MKRMVTPDKRSSSRFLARVLPDARPGPMAGFIKPSLPTLRDRAPAGDQWVHEIKFDGYRVQAHLKGATPTLFTRSGFDWTQRFGRIAAAVQRLPVNEIILDGEVIVQAANGASDFGALEEDLASGRQDRFVYYAFDLLHLDGFDITAAPLDGRKRVLAALLGEAGSAAIAYSEHLETDGEAMFARALVMGLEGIVSKRRDGPYRPGRTSGWLKIKTTREVTLAIVGYAVRSGRLSSLHVARRTGKKLVYAGQVGTGFSAKVAADLESKLASYRTDKPPAPVPVATARDRWVKPSFQALIEHRGISADGHLRHAAFKGLQG